MLNGSELEIAEAKAGQTSRLSEDDKEGNTLIV